MSNVVKFKRAVKSQAKLRLGLVGPSGAGKTYTALSVGQHLGKKVAVIDTERGSASLYADKFAFDVIELQDFSVDAYVAAMKAAADGGYDVLVVDSLSPAWEWLKGVVEEIARTCYRGNTWSAWSEGTPIQQKLVEAILQYPGHVIGTMRAKTAWETEKDEKGKTRPVKVGLAPIQRDNFEYEWTIVLELGEGGLARVGKTRWSDIEGRPINKPGENFAKGLLAWLNAGAPVETKPVPNTERGASPAQEPEGARSNLALGPAPPAPTPTPSVPSSPISPTPAGAVAEYPIPTNTSATAPAVPSSNPPAQHGTLGEAMGLAPGSHPLAPDPDPKTYIDQATGVLFREPEASYSDFVDHLARPGAILSPSYADALAAIVAADAPNKQDAGHLRDLAVETHGKDRVDQTWAKVTGRKRFVLVPGIVFRTFLLSLPKRQAEATPEKELEKDGALAELGESVEEGF